MSDLPPPTPAGVLIRDARKMAIPRRSIPEVAHSVGIDPGTLGNIERGYRHVGSNRTRPVRADAPTLAKLARELGITPERLEADGERPDAAAIMRKDGPGDRGAPPREGGLSLLPPAELPASQGSPSEQERDRLIATYPDDEVLQVIGRQRNRKPSTVVAEMLEWLDIRAAHSSDGTAG